MVYTEKKFRARGKRGAGRRMPIPDECPQQQEETALIKRWSAAFVSFWLTLALYIGKFIICTYRSIISGVSAAARVTEEIFRSEFNPQRVSVPIMPQGIMPQVQVSISKLPTVVVDPISLHKNTPSHFTSPSDEFSHDLNEMREYNWAKLCKEDQAEDSPVVTGHEVRTPADHAAERLAERHAAQMDRDMLNVLLDKLGEPRVTVNASTLQVTDHEIFMPTLADFDRHKSPHRGDKCACVREPGDTGILCGKCMENQAQKRTTGERRMQFDNWWGVKKPQYVVDGISQHLQQASGVNDVVDRCNHIRAVGDNNPLCNQCRWNKERARADARLQQYAGVNQKSKTKTIISCNCIRLPGDPLIGLCNACTNPQKRIRRKTGTWGQWQEDQSWMFPTTKGIIPKGIIPKQRNQYTTPTKQAFRHANEYKEAAVKPWGSKPTIRSPSINTPRDNAVTYMDAILRGDNAMQQINDRSDNIVFDSAVDTDELITDPYVPDDAMTLSH